MEINTVELASPYSEIKIIAPQSFLFFRVAEVAELISVEGSGEFVKFGLIEPAVDLVVSESSGEVYSWLKGYNLEFVNTSLVHFTSCIRALAEKYPFYLEDSEEADWDRAAREVERIIKAIDPPAYKEGSLWYNFRWDVTTGDFHE